MGSFFSFKALKAAALSATALLCGGCATHLSQTQPVRAAWSAGQAQVAQAALAPFANEYLDSDDEVVWQLEYGTAARANADIKTSVKAFDRAEKRINSFDKNADTVIFEETAAILTNQSYLPYRGYNYDKIMLCAYQSLNYMELKDFDKAEVELKRMENFQQDAKNANIRRIEESEKAIKAAKEQDKNASYDARKTLADDAIMDSLKSVYGNDFSMNPRVRASSEYINPFGYWLAGVYFCSRPADMSDKNRAADFFRLAAQSAGVETDGFAQDIKLSEDLADGKIAKMPNRTYVIFETGAAPLRNQFKVNLPLYIINQDVPHVSMNFPYLKYQEPYAQNITVSADGVKTQFQKIADMDEIVKREFYDELPMVITKTIISAAVKAGAQAGAKQAVGDGWAGLAVNIAGSIYQNIMNDADLRTWTTLPKQIKVASFDTPKSGTIHVDGKPVKVNPDSTNIVSIRKMSIASSVLVRTFDLSNKK